MRSAEVSARVPVGNGANARDGIPGGDPRVAIGRREVEPKGGSGGTRSVPWIEQVQGKTRLVRGRPTHRRATHCPYGGTCHPDVSRPHRGRSDGKVGRGFTVTVGGEETGQRRRGGETAGEENKIGGQETEVEKKD